MLAGWSGVCYEVWWRQSVLSLQHKSPAATRNIFFCLYDVPGHSLHTKLRGPLRSCALSDMGIALAFLFYLAWKEEGGEGWRGGEEKRYELWEERFWEIGSGVVLNGLQCLAARFCCWPYHIRVGELCVNIRCLLCSPWCNCQVVLFQFQVCMWPIYTTLLLIASTSHLRLLMHGNYISECLFHYQ